jgi:hypothetical protein
VPILFRRGPYSGPGFLPTADPRFRRVERIRVDAPVARPGVTTARLLDRRGQPLQVPMTTGEREDSGVSFVTGELGLAPLAPADYLIEITVRRGDRDERRLVAFRIVP